MQLGTGNHKQVRRLRKVQLIELERDWQAVSRMENLCHHLTRLVVAVLATRIV